MCRRVVLLLVRVSEALSTGPRGTAVIIMTVIIVINSRNRCLLDESTSTAKARTTSLCKLGASREKSIEWGRGKADFSLFLLPNWGHVIKA